jgi:hypothetical protein
MRDLAMYDDRTDSADYHAGDSCSIEQQIKFGNRQPVVPITVQQQDRFNGHEQAEATK